MINIFLRIFEANELCCYGVCCYHAVGSHYCMKINRIAGEWPNCFTAYATVNDGQVWCEGIVCPVYHLIDSKRVVFGLVDLGQCAVHVLHAKGDTCQQMGLHCRNGNDHVGINYFL